MPVRPARWFHSPLGLAVAGLFWLLLLPLRAYADDRDAAEIGHAIWFVGVFSLFFLSAMSLAIWLLVVRLRSGPDTAPEAAPHYPSLEKVWSKEARDAAPSAAALPGETADK